MSDTIPENLQAGNEVMAIQTLCVIVVYAIMYLIIRFILDLSIIYTAITALMCISVYEFFLSFDLKDGLFTPPTYFWTMVRKLVKTVIVLGMCGLDYFLIGFSAYYLWYSPNPILNPLHLSLKIVISIFFLTGFIGTLFYLDHLIYFWKNPLSKYGGES